MIKTAKEILHKEVYEYIHPKKKTRNYSTLYSPKLPEGLSNLEYNYDRTLMDRWLLPF